MKFQVKKGKVPVEIRFVGDPGMYDPVRFALRGAQPYEWLHVDVSEGEGSKIGNSLANGNTRTKRMFGGEFKIQTRIRRTEHDRTIPLDIERVFFRKVPVSSDGV